MGEWAIANCPSPGTPGEGRGEGLRVLAFSRKRKVLSLSLRERYDDVYVVAVRAGVRRPFASSSAFDMPALTPTLSRRERE